MRAAREGDAPALRRAIAAREHEGTLSNPEAAAIAEAVARRDLQSSSHDEGNERGGDQGGDRGVGRVRDVLPCAHELDDALSDRMGAHDSAGAAAALARIDGRGLSLGDARAFASEGDARWRAVGARALVRSADRSARLRAMADDSPLVRRQAVRAAREAADVADLGPLVDAARLDPEPIVRTEAIRAIAVLPPVSGHEAVNALRDLWTSGDDGLREDIALAWAAPSLWDAGGQDALYVLIAAGHGPGAIEGAVATLRHQGARRDVVEAAAGQLVRSIATGSRASRLQALAEAPLDRSDLVEVTRSAATDEDLQVRVAALARLAATAGVQASSAIAALESLAQPVSPVAQRARFALAGVGDRRVQSWLEADLSAPAPEDRLGAATALAILGVSARAAPLLADNDASVRDRAACTLIMAARIGR